MMSSRELIPVPEASSVPVPEIKQTFEECSTLFRERFDGDYAAHEIASMLVNAFARAPP